MRIGDLAKRAGTTTRTLRFYESQGLLSAQRSPNGYREYGEEEFRLVREIQMLQSIGFSLDDTRPFVECLRTGHESGDDCADSIETYRRKLAEVDACLERLSAARESLVGKLTEALARQPSPCEVGDRIAARLDDERAPQP
ncbi:MerR family transcriptional regulator [Phytoactinopolyspora halotolerans]|uniref:MerR family transcriptional regulator n=1 Tax=Phytoactinopolyspora halotolerans TaxID=1981512 RepID=A0A6L9SFA6_9ACTN|nr:MerR family transcriptional regulator [Phytoactinopolyspora halotolerans]NEE03817.1 MerR family transcriptional regulator [Phytoactinopolyspora halotolerans]